VRPSRTDRHDASQALETPEVGEKIAPISFVELAGVAASVGVALAALAQQGA